MSPPRLVVMDWGVGGFGAYALLRAACPRLDVVYLSDAGFTPYGRAPRAALRARLAWAAAVTGAGELLIACNAACSALEPPPAPSALTPAPSALTPAPPEPPLALPPHLGVLRAGIELTREAAARALAERAGAQGGGARVRVGVVGGHATVRSGAYERALAAPGVEVTSRAAQPISAHVEAGRLSGEELHRDLREICAPLRGVDLLALACTHYPAARAAWAAHLPETLLLDPATRLVAEAVGAWGLAARGGEGRLEVLTTGDPAALRAAALAAFGVRVGAVARLPLDPPPLAPLPLAP